MAEEPEMKRVVGFVAVVKSGYHIIFETSDDTLINSLMEFGEVVPSNRYSLYIDFRYDFDDVLAYMESFNEADND